MKRQIIAVAIGCLFSLSAFANAEIDYPPQASTAIPAKTVAQVRDELIAAKRAGDFVVNAETGQKANQLIPSAYPARAAVGGKSREEVLVELIAAKRTGDVIVNAETGETVNQI